MSAARELASSKLGELEEYVQALEADWIRAKDTLTDKRVAFNTMVEDDEEGFDEIAQEIDEILQQDGERF